MIPATLLSRALSATRRLGPSVLAAAPGRLVVSGEDAWCQLESPQVVDTFQCRNIESLSSFLSGLRRSIEVIPNGQQPILRMSGRELMVERLAVAIRSPRLDPAFVIRVSRPRLEEATERFSRKDAACLLHYTDDALHLDDDSGSSSISYRRRSAGPERIARTVSGQLLRRVVAALRTDDLEMRISGEWNGAGPVVLSECGDVDGTRLTIAIRGDSYRRVRHLALRASAQPQREPSIYNGLTEGECETIATFEDGEDLAHWIDAREWDLHRLYEMAEDQDRRSERAELLEHVEWEAHEHRKKYLGGCGLAACDVCEARNGDLARAKDVTTAER